jgi:hypothetical protein
MLALRIRINDLPPVTAGAEHWRLVHANVVISRRIAGRDDHDDLHMHLGGLSEAPGLQAEHLRWALPDLAPGDIVTIEVVEAEAVDPPAHRFNVDAPLPQMEFTPEEWRATQKREYLRLKAKFEP